MWVSVELGKLVENLKQIAAKRVHYYKLKQYKPQFT